MARLLTLILITLFSFLVACNAKDKQQVDSKHVSSLVNPAKASNLKSDRAANPRFRSLMFFIHQAEEAGIKPRD